jgi:trehalose-phosphatase
MDTAAPLLRTAEIEQRITTAGQIGLFLDFDGTISHIVPEPSAAEIDPAIRRTLKALARREDISLAIVSGRSLEDVRRRVQIPNTIYVGNHGLEIDAGQLHFRHPKAEALRNELKCIVLQLQLALSETEGVEIEHKGITVSVHYRRVPAQLQSWVRNGAIEAVRCSKSFAARTGHMVVEVVPAIPWNKGHAVQWICREVLRGLALPIYIGDDTTDEDAFGAIPEGITIRVGDPAQTEAQYLLPDVTAVGGFLTWLERTKPHGALERDRRAGQ